MEEHVDIFANQDAMTIYGIRIAIGRQTSAFMQLAHR
jgi:hypothetical protein